MLVTLVGRLCGELDRRSASLFALLNGEAGRHCPMVAPPLHLVGPIPEDSAGGLLLNPLGQLVIGAVRSVCYKLCINISCILSCALASDGAFVPTAPLTVPTLLCAANNSEPLGQCFH